MSKKILKIEFSFDFTLIGISSSAKDYRLTWFMNNELDLEFVRTEDLEMELENEQVGYFPIYHFLYENSETELYLVTNKGINGFLIPENKETDYFIVSNMKLADSEEKELVAKINRIEVVQAAYSLNPETLKSKENLLFF